MKLYEYQAKKILRERGIPVPEGAVASSNDEVYAYAEKFGGNVAIKSQVHVGGRGKAGGITLARNPQEAKEKSSAMLGKELKGLLVRKVLIEETIEFSREFYVGFAVDRRKGKNTLIFTSQGGMEVEEVAAKDPHALCRFLLNPGEGIKHEDVLVIRKMMDIDEKKFSEFKNIMYALYDIYRGSDCELLEINPLVLTVDKKWIALDAKMIIDDNALFRQKELACLQEETETDTIEQEAHRRKIAYVRLEGDTGIIGNGAGLVMATMDEVKHAGGRPANFLDIGGGAKAELMKNALEIVLMDPQVKAIFINIFGGITRCDEVAKGIISAFSEKNIRLPIVVRLAGTRCEEGKQLLKDTSFIFADSMKEGAERIVSLIFLK